VPIEYAAQSMFGLMITGRDVCQYGVLFGSDNLVLYHVLRDDETIANMRALAVAFWNDHVLARVPPSPRTMNDLRKLWPKPTRAAIEATPEIETVLTEHAALGREIATRISRRDELSFQIGEFVQDFATVITKSGDPVATYKAQSRESIDGKALAAHPTSTAIRQDHQFRVLRHFTRRK
jgi:predicted phage-related endonuclease